MKNVGNNSDNKQWENQFSGSINASMKAHTEEIVAHSLKFNLSLRGLENMTRIVNSTPSASIQIPQSRYKIKKLIKPVYSSEYHIKCEKCQIYSHTTSTESPAMAKCVQCHNILKTSNSNFFIYIPIKQQLLRIIDKQFPEIIAYRANRNSDDETMTDMHEGIN